ncbi:RagB/SusD family nutrient uptake outer membrane protein [Olivibacter sp. SDN3]|uniref:RagB/SusD family nutrient uptake outer membrane protein n=1 Tax=Olivibacter sp. SDN3 TaxID=2764720 RepID=UPI0016519173|nr:RagB/SusD family nutrient uptake outer membrane protein [Olivibacter sp. SDN3]QNL51070.1 RagB/SusD family nutrient uptake outer membrane protein [Olivibacter sp. SDN3]
MKHLKIYISAILAVVMVSCKDSFLDLQPISSAASENFYKTAEDMKVALNGTYAALRRSGISTNNYVFGEISSDNTYPVASGSVTDQDELDRFYIRTTNPFIAGRWNDGYNAILRANTVLEKIEPVEMDDELKRRYIAEAKFLRAFVYFELVRTFGDVPLVTKSLMSDLDEAYDYGRDAASAVYAQIETDLSEAEADLPVSFTGGDLGRVTQGAAKALLGKIYLTQNKYPEAAAKLKEVIDLNIYDLVSYEAAFDPAQKNGREAVFEIQFAAGMGIGNPWPNAFAPQNSGNAVINFGGGGNNRPTQDLIDAYEPEDIRRDFSLATSYVNADGQTIQDVYVRKYRFDPALNNDNANNIPVIRYADVLLMYAECLNEQGYEANGEAFSYLNRIRERAGLAEKSAADIPNQEAFRLAMEQERRVEFAFEGHRWYDLVRTGRAITVINSKAQEINLVAPITQNNLVFPIPQSQIDINQGKITQNPGY